MQSEYVNVVQPLIPSFRNMDLFIGLVLLFVVLPILAGWFFVDHMTRGKGQQMAQQFAQLGDLRGKTYNDIVALLATEPTLRQGAENGWHGTWSQGSYAITLLFDSENVCQGVTAELNI